jgi:hypothetical protein
MIRVEKQPEPDQFDAHCRAPGNAWLTAHPDQHQCAPPYWTEFKPHLRQAFGERCAWLAMWIAGGTVDHFHAQRDFPEQIYEWSNFRYSDSEINSAKKPAWEGRLLDPFEVDDGWFEILLPSCQLRILEQLVPEAMRERVRFTVSSLRLDHGEKVVDLRRHWLEQYESQSMTIEALERHAPLVARAVRKRDATR